MSVGYEIVLSLGILIIILEIIRWENVPKKRLKKGVDIGSCMTIGDREVQEDCMDTVISDHGVMLALADGAGKVYGGKIASKLAVDTCAEMYKDYNAFNNPQYYFRKVFHNANREILKAVQEERRGNASLACALIQAGYLYYALVGNIRICVFREGTLVPVSSGQTVDVLAEQRFREGKISRQEALELLENHRRYNYLGREEFRDIEIFDTPIQLKHYDIVVMMSDGVYDLLGQKEIEDILKSRQNCQDKAFEIVEKINTNAEEDKDNASIILIQVGNGVLK